MPKIVLVGAGSATFGLKMLRDIVLTPGLRGSKLALVDVNEEALANIAGIAERVVKERGFPLEIQSYTDRNQALIDADYVLLSVARDKDRLWKLDYTIPIKHGLKQTVGENGGVGGVFHTLRSVWLTMEIVKDVERLAPNAWILNLTNPMRAIGMAVDHYSKLRCVGLCTGILEQRRRLGEFLGIPTEEMDFLASGLNHFTWIHNMTRAGTGEDLYPLLREKLAGAPPDDQRQLRFPLGDN